MSIRAKIMVAGMIVVVMCVPSLFAIGSLDWYTEASGEDILYTSDGEPGVGDKSLFDVQGSDQWYAMMYDTDALDAANFDVSDYATVEDARNDVIGSELYGGRYLSLMSGNPQYSYIYQEDIQDDNLSGRNVGTIVFNTSDPNAADLSGMMFAYSTSSKGPLPDFTPSQGVDPTAVYDAGVIGFDGAEWKAVPEPVSAMIAFLGVPVLVLARRRFNRK